MPSSPIDLARDVIEAARAAGMGAGFDPGSELFSLPCLFGKLTDPRRRQGRRHRLVVILVAALAAVLAGAVNFTEIASWADDEINRVALRHAGVSAPSGSTIRRVLLLLPAVVLAQATARFFKARLPKEPDRVRAFAVDGKEARGVRASGKDRLMLLSAMDHASGISLGNIEISAKTNEIPAVGDLLAQIGDIRGVCLTADALHAQDKTAEMIRQAAGHYLFGLKKNRPHLHRDATGQPWTQVEPAFFDVETAHGRRSTWQVKVIHHALGMPGARAVVQVIRTKKKQRAKGRGKQEIAYAITSLPPHLATPDTCARLLRGHWEIEARVHYVRDVTFREDACLAHEGNGPANLAILRSIGINVHRLAGQMG